MPKKRSFARRQHQWRVKSAAWNIKEATGGSLSGTHRQVDLPIWLYVSVTGVLVYLMLYQM